MCAGALESERAGEPSKLIRERYRAASQVVQNQVRSLLTFISDVCRSWVVQNDHIVGVRTGHHVAAVRTGEQCDGMGLTRPRWWWWWHRQGKGGGLTTAATAVSGGAPQGSPIFARGAGSPTKRLLLSHPIQTMERGGKGWLATLLPPRRRPDRGGGGSLASRWRPPDVVSAGGEGA
ncbi:hypothetical protein Sjap_010505 [Stephania japonica]|uniref:Uncharacterized protein n=1 Tax=Stephania japonica TaxID=461633 RepID=A0AAP0J9Q6_9MAGN